MTKRRRLGCAIAVLLMLITVGSLLTYELNKGWTPGYAERMAGNDVPLGSTEENAKTWLSSHGFTEIHSGSAEGLRYFTQDVISLEGAMSYCYGYAPNPNVDLQCDGFIAVYFFFGSDGRLIKTYVVSSICGL